MIPVAHPRHHRSSRSKRKSARKRHGGQDCWPPWHPREAQSTAPQPWFSHRDYSIVEVCATISRAPDTPGPPTTRTCRPQLVWLPKPTWDASFWYWDALITKYKWQTHLCSDQGRYIDVNGQFQASLDDRLSVAKDPWPVHQLRSLVGWLGQLHADGWCVGSFDARDLWLIEHPSAESDDTRWTWILMGARSVTRLPTSVDDVKVQQSWDLPGCSVPARLPVPTLSSIQHEASFRESFISTDWFHLELLLRRTENDHGVGPLQLFNPSNPQVAVRFRLFDPAARWARRRWMSICTSIPLEPLNVMTSHQASQLQTMTSSWDLARSTFWPQALGADLSQVDGWVVVDLFSGWPTIGWQRTTSTASSSGPAVPKPRGQFIRVQGLSSPAYESFFDADESSWNQYASYWNELLEQLARIWVEFHTSSEPKWTTWPKNPIWYLMLPHWPVHFATKDGSPASVLSAVPLRTRLFRVCKNNPQWTNVLPETDSSPYWQWIDPRLLEAFQAFQQVFTRCPVPLSPVGERVFVVSVRVGLCSTNITLLECDIDRQIAHVLWTKQQVGYGWYANPAWRTTNWIDSLPALLASQDDVEFQQRWKSTKPQVAAFLPPLLPTVLPTSASDIRDVPVTSIAPSKLPDLISTTPPNIPITSPSSSTASPSESSPSPPPPLLSTIPLAELVSRSRPDLPPAIPLSTTGTISREEWERRTRGVLPSPLPTPHTVERKRTERPERPKRVMYPFPPSDYEQKIPLADPIAEPTEDDDDTGDVNRGGDNGTESITLDQFKSWYFQVQTTLLLNLLQGTLQFLRSGPFSSGTRDGWRWLIACPESAQGDQDPLSASSLLKRFQPQTLSDATVATVIPPCLASWSDAPLDQAAETFINQVVFRKSISIQPARIYVYSSAQW